MAAKVFYGAASHGKINALAERICRLGDDSTEVCDVVDAKADMATLRRVPKTPLHLAIGRGLAIQVISL